MGGDSCRLESFGRFAVRLAKGGNALGRCLRETGGSLSEIAGAKGISQRLNFASMRRGTDSSRFRRPAPAGWWIVSHHASGQD